MDTHRFLDMILKLDVVPIKRRPTLVRGGLVQTAEKVEHVELNDAVVGHDAQGIGQERGFVRGGEAKEAVEELCAAKQSTTC